MYLFNFPAIEVKKVFFRIDTSHQVHPSGGSEPRAGLSAAAAGGAGAGGRRGPAPAQQPGGAGGGRRVARRARALPPHGRGGARGRPAQRPLRHLPARERVRGPQVAVGPRFNFPQ